jgi:hypothetical protein
LLAHRSLTLAVQMPLARHRVALDLQGRVEVRDPQ